MTLPGIRNHYQPGSGGRPGSKVTICTGHKTAPPPVSVEVKMGRCGRIPDNFGPLDTDDEDQWPFL